MSIQRKSVLVESDGGYGGMVNDRLGAYVTYADHLAEVERLRQVMEHDDDGRYVTYADSQRTNQATVRTTNEHE